MGVFIWAIILLFIAIDIFGKDLIFFIIIFIPFEFFQTLIKNKKIQSLVAIVYSVVAFASIYLYLECMYNNMYNN